MTSNKLLDMRKRTVLQYLSTSDWKMIHHLSTPVGDMTIGRIHQDCIDIRGEGMRAEARLTEAGLKANAIPGLETLVFSKSQLKIMAIKEEFLKRVPVGEENAVTGRLM